uniref:Ribosomal biogenesis protein gar2 n=1 Tax=Colletotrichum fructicola (strain Nara gc5) TaxID=1213859 RepID=L2GGP8_COLFN
MAPELRKRTRSVTAAENAPAAKKVTKAEKVEKTEPAPTKAKAEKAKAEKVEKVEKKATPKRKAPEEASPVAAKKQKPAKATPKTTPKSKKAAAKPEPAEEPEPEPETTEVVEEEAETSVIPVEDGGDSDEEIDADIQALAAGKKQKKSIGGSSEEPGVVFISRLPHGFYEHELKGYFSQFGKINRLRLARNKKTGASKHWAFIEFAEESTAQIVAKTMDSYLLFGHILKVKTVPKESLHENLWKGANKRFKKIPWNKMAANEVAKKRTESTWAQKVSREEKKREERAKKLKAIGYEFDTPDLKKAVAPPPEPMAIDAPEEPKAIEAAPAEEKPAEEEAAPAAEEEAAETPKTKAKAKKGGRRKSKN